jgi:broad specificity phosphatase PhoE
MQTFHFIRHAQSLHNALSEPGQPDPMGRDAALTELGLEQAQRLGAEMTGGPEFDLVVITPFTRAIQTALRAFGQSAAPRVILDLHREHLDSYCDVGRSPAHLGKLFPMFEFDHLNDPWWYVDAASEAPYEKEPAEVLEKRVADFGAWLKARPEQTIGVVGHGTFLWKLTGHRFLNAERLIANL